MSHRVALKETRRDAATQAIDYGVYDNYGRRCGAVVTKYTIDSRAATKDDISYLNLEDIPEDAGPTLYYGNSQVTRDGKLSAHYENTVVVTENGAEILTAL